MSSPGFQFVKRIGNERLEVNASGDVLKKYNGGSANWPTHSKVQYYGQSHADQQRELNQANANIANFFKGNF